MSNRVYRASVRRSRWVPLMVSGLLACESTSSPSPVYERTVTPEMVTGAAAVALGADGHFHPEPPPTTTGQVSLGEARAQSLEFARYMTNNVLLRGAVEAGRGGYWTDPHLLTLCDDAWFVHSQLGHVALDTVAASAAQSFLRRFGPQWLIPMCGPENEPQMTVQVAIDSNSVRFADGEPIEPYTSLSTAWFARGVPLNWPDVFPVSAERAVRFVFETFGVRVTEVPQLEFRGDVLPDGRYVWFQIGSAKDCNRWRITLESPVTIRGMTSLTTTTTDVIHVAALSCQSTDVIPYVHLPYADQPQEVILDYFDDSVMPIKAWIVHAPVVAPVRFEIGTRAP